MSTNWFSEDRGGYVVGETITTMPTQAIINNSEPGKPCSCIALNTSVNTKRFNMKKGARPRFDRGRLEFSDPAAGERYIFEADMTSRHVLQAYDNTQGASARSMKPWPIFMTYIGWRPMEVGINKPRQIRIETARKERIAKRGPEPYRPRNLV